MSLRTVVCILASLTGAAAFRPMAPARPRPTLSRAAVTPSMLVPEAVPDAGAMQHVLDAATGLLANSGMKAEAFTPLLAAQCAVIVAMLGGGTALAIWGDVEEPEEPGAEEGSVDIYRDTPLRFLGYANECGEAFRPLIPVAFVYATYVAAIAYIVADTVDKGKKGGEGQDEALLRTVVYACDTFCWQMLASVIYPSYIINRLVLLLVILQADPSCPELLTASWIPTVAGLIAIPLIITPLDTLAHQTLNLSYRKVSEKIIG